MKIFFPFVGDTIGGSHHSAVTLIDELKSSGHQLSVVLHEKGPLEKFLREKKVEYSVAGLPYWKSIGPRSFRVINLTLTLFRVAKYLYQQRPGIVHVNDGRMAISWSIPCRLLGIPIVVHQRTKFTPSRITLMSLLAASRVICISQFTKNSLPDRIKGKTSVIRNPFVSDAASMARKKNEIDFREILGLSASTFVILFVGTIQDQKRPLIALETLRILRNQGVDARLVIAGRCNARGRRLLSDFLNNHGLTDLVSVLGQVSEINDLFGVADVLLAPAIDEGHGRAIVEAMIAGVPVVAAASGGHNEILVDGETGRLVTPDEPIQFATALRRYVEDHKFVRYIVNKAKAHAIRVFCDGSHSSLVESVYRQALGPTAFVIESFGGGGAQQVLANLIQHLVRRGDELSVITFQPPSVDQIVIPKNVERYWIGASRPSSSILVAVFMNILRFWRLRRAIKKSRSKVVVSFINTTNVLTILATLGLGIRVVVSERNDYSRQKVSLVWSFMRRVTYPFADYVTANSENTLTELSKFIRDDKLVLTLNSIRPVKDQKIHQSSAPYILAVGRLHPQKDYRTLLKAFALLRRDGLRLKILGTGPLRDELMGYAEDFDIAHKVDFLGYVDNPFPYYRDAEIFVMSSKYEGSPNALWEAMSQGAPSIISDSIVGATHLVDDGTHLLSFRGGDASDLALKMNELMSNDFLRDSLRRNAMNFTQRFSDEKVNHTWDRLIF